MTRVRIERIRTKGGVLIDPKSINREASRIGNVVASSMRRQANETVKSWEKKPAISTKRQTTGDSFYVILEIDSFIWSLLDKGTKPHIIAAKTAPFLAFNSKGFIAKTKVGQFASGSGQKANSGFVQKKAVKHPGFPARGWSDEIKKTAEELASREWRKGLDNILKSRMDVK
jgi:hypothetical protein